jgi:hypothetical protein
MSSNSPAGRLQVMRFKWVDICRAPCGITVDPRGTYRIGGGTVRPSETFTMPRSTGVVDIDTQVGSTVRHWVGVGMIIGGLATVAGGGLLLAAASDMTNTTDAFGNPTSNGQDVLKTEGIVYIVIGAIITAIGIPLAASSTSVEVR